MIMATMQPRTLSRGKCLLKSFFIGQMSQQTRDHVGLNIQCHRGYCAILNPRHLTTARKYPSLKSWHGNTNTIVRNIYVRKVIRHISCGSHHHKQSTFDQSEVDKFSSLSSKWWDEQGEFVALHSLNTLRIPLIRDALLEAGPGSGHSDIEPLTGLRIVDVGCGGGILSEPLVRIGAHVLGVDASAENIATAEAHAALDPCLADRLIYKAGLVEDLAAEVGPVYDGVVASEILEHVADVPLFVKACCDLVKPAGSIFFTTLNRTQVAYVLAVVTAECLLKIVPAGAHDWNKFVTPEELSFILKQNGADVMLVHGMCLNPFSLRWSWSSNISINYAIHAVKQ